jgi:hypothetical protein
MPGWHFAVRDQNMSRRLRRIRLPREALARGTGDQADGAG